MDAGPKGIVSPVRFERTLPSLSCWCLLPLGYEDVEPSPGADPGRLPYGGRVTSRVRRHGFRGWTRTSEGRIQSPAWDADAHPEMECGRRDSNAQAASFEEARSAGCRHSGVRRQGLEPCSPD